MPVVRTDGRSLAGSVYGHVITKFSGMGRLPHFLSYGAPPTRALRARVELRYQTLVISLLITITGKVKWDIEKNLKLCELSHEKASKVNSVKISPVSIEDCNKYPVVSLDLQRITRVFVVSLFFLRLSGLALSCFLCVYVVFMLAFDL